MVIKQSFSLVLLLFINCAVIIQAGGLADGTDVGSVVGNLWTPGKQNGVVNKASWDIVPQNKWMDIAGTRLDALASQVEQMYPGWSDPSVLKWNGITDAWNGIAYDEAGHRAWWVAAGGHRDGANNGIYMFDAFKMQYSIEKMPSDTRPWSTAYTALQNTWTYSYCNESGAVRAAKVANGTAKDINDIYGDELLWDGQPCSRHTYSGALYIPGKEELVLAVSRLWRYSLTEHKWYVKVVPTGATPYQIGAALAEENVAHYDQVNDQVVVFSCGSGGPYSNVFNMSNNRWTNQSTIGEGWDWNAAADWRFNNTLTIFRAVEAEGDYKVNGTYISYDITTRKIFAQGTVQYGPGVRRNDFPQTDSNGMVYIPPLNKYWVVQRNATDQFAWMQLDPSTTPWTYSYLNFDSPTPTLANTKVVRRRMMWLPNLNAVLWLGSASKNASIYKLGPYVPVPPTTTGGVQPTTSTTTTTITTTTTTAPATTGSKTSTTATAATTKSSTAAPGSTTNSAGSSSGSPAMSTTTGDENSSSSVITASVLLSVAVLAVFL